MSAADEFLNGTTSGDGPFGQGAPVYAGLGYTGIVPLNRSTKDVALKGVTGRDGAQTTPEQYGRDGVLYRYKHHNIGWRLPHGLVGIDVDEYGSKHGATQLAELEAQFGKLPDTWSSTARGDGPSRIYFFRVPEDCGELKGSAAPDIDVIQHHHRYARVWPSRHEKIGDVYRWYNGQVSDRPPAPDAFAELPAAWLEYLTKPQHAQGEGAGLDVEEFTERFTKESDPELVDRIREKFEHRQGSRHGTMLECLGWAARQAVEGKVHAGGVFGLLEEDWYAAFDVPGSREPGENEFAKMRATVVEEAPEAPVAAPQPSPAGTDQPPDEESPEDVRQTRLDAMRAKLLDRAALKKIPKPEYLVEGWLRERSSGRTNGDPGSGKSLLLLDWAACIGAGIPWNGHETKQGLVIYVVAEGVDTFDWRVTAWEKHYGREMEGVLVYPEPIQILGRTGRDLAESEEWGDFRALCAELKPAFVILDTQRRVTLAAEENGNSDLQKAVEALDHLKRDVGCAWHLVHHTPKHGTGGSGGGALWGSVDSEFEMTKKGRGLKARFFLESTKQKSGVDGERLEFQLQQFIVGEPDEERAPFDELPDDWADAETSVVLVPVDPDEREEHREDEVDLSLPADATPRQKLIDLFGRVWGAVGGSFTKAEGWNVVSKAGAMARQTYYRNFAELLAEGVLVQELSDKGAKLQRYKIKAG